MDERVRVPSSPSKALAVRGVYEVKKYSRSSFVLLAKPNVIPGGSRRTSSLGERRTALLRWARGST